MVNEFIAQTDRGANVRLDWLYGADKGNNNNLILIKSQN
jgi:hypothetical protein